MPDEVLRPARPVDAPRSPADLADALCEFARAFPAWTTPDGFPRSWRHYVLGMGHLGRASARESLRLAQAAAIGQSTPEGFRAWQRDVLPFAGV